MTSLVPQQLPVCRAQAQPRTASLAARPAPSTHRWAARATSRQQQQPHALPQPAGRASAAAAAAAAALAALLPAGPALAAASAAAQQPIVELAAAALDEAPEWTLDQAVGLVFGGLLLVLYLGSTQVDKFVARDQRRQLGLCEECGGLNEPGSCAEKNCPLRRQ